MKKFIMAFVCLMTMVVSANAQNLIIEGSVGLSAPVKKTQDVLFDFQLIVGVKTGTNVSVGLDYSNRVKFERNVDYSVQSVGLKFYYTFISIDEVEVNANVGIGYGWETYYFKHETLKGDDFIVPKMGVDVMFNVGGNKNAQLGIGSEYVYYTNTDSHKDNISAVNLLGKLRLTF